MKLLIEEPGTDAASELWDNSTSLVASQLVVPEVGAALATAERSRRIDDDRARIARGEWRRYLLALDLIDVTADIAERGAMLAAVHPLSGSGAVHLATAVTFREVDLVAATWDRRLAAAAAAEGLVVIPEPT